MRRTGWSIIPDAPYPSFKDWRAVLRRRVEPADTAGDSGESLGRTKIFFSRGLWALAEAVSACSQVLAKKRCRVFVPDYFCNTALYGVRQADVEIVFYPVSRGLMPDYGQSDPIIRTLGKPDIFVLVHYFGFPCGAQQALDFCQRHTALLIEDCAHALWATNSIGRAGYAAVFSPRKTWGLPDGGLVVFNSTVKDVCAPDRQTVEARRPIPMPWIVKKTVQRIVRNCRVPLMRQYLPAHGDDGDGHIGPEKEMGAFSRALFNSMQPYAPEYARRRRMVFMSLAERLTGRLTAAGGTVKAVFQNLPEDAVPYCYPLLCEPSQVEAVYASLQAQGIPAYSWPDLPPEVGCDTSRYDAARYLRRSLIALPVHQSLTEWHVQRMADGVIQSVYRLKNTHRGIKAVHGPT